ncbi:MAG TPA: XRE family transcriptional regulator [Devosiaceae bacterium]|nr:XRE family transcriptional regulator [Devosiaceae bacterium]
MDDDGRLQSAQPKVGPLIRARRRQLHLTLQELADGAGISIGYVSLVERDLATPTLGTLAQIARSLNVGVDYFISTPDVESALSRASERQPFSINGSSIIYERIGTDFAGNVLSSFILTIPSGYRSETVSHEGEEIIFMLAGELTVRVEPDSMVLGEGDAFHFRGNRPHSWCNTGSAAARLLWSGTVPLFRPLHSPPQVAEKSPAVHPST